MLVVTDPEVLFVVKPWHEGLGVPRAFQMRLSPEGIRTLIDQMGERRAFQALMADGTQAYFTATVTESPYGYVQLEPV